VLCAVADRELRLKQQVSAIVKSRGISLEKVRMPAVVAVGNERGYHCSGVLVDKQAVLTARHCLPTSRVLLGRSLVETSTEVRVVEAASAPGAADVALLRLAVPVNVPAVTRRSTEDPSPPLRRMRLAGFGTSRTAEGRDFGREHYTDLPGQASWGCDSQRAGWAGCDPALEMVIARTGGRDTCDGDSGGPVFELLTQGEGLSRTCQWQLLGITSRPIASARVRCGDGGVYTRVDVLEHWIDGVLMGWASPALNEGKAP
jgi:secreted trypsin-like serine protease